MAEQYGAYREIDHEPTGAEVGKLVQECLRAIDEKINARGASFRTNAAVIIKKNTRLLYDPIIDDTDMWTVAVKCDVEGAFERDNEIWDAGCRTD